MHGGLIEQDEIVGYHLESAYRNRVELDRADESLDALGRRAATSLIAAGSAAEARGDIGAMSGLLVRAAAFLPKGDEQRLECLLIASYPLNMVGNLVEARKIERELADSHDERFRAYALLIENLNGAYAATWVAARAEANVAAARKTFDTREDCRDLGSGGGPGNNRKAARHAGRGRGGAHARAGRH